MIRGLISVLSLAGLLLIQQSAVAQSPVALLHRSQKAVTSVIVHDIFSPPVASRIYLYSSIAAYEALTVTREVGSFQGIRKDFIAPDPAAYSGKVNTELSAVYAMLLTASKFLFSDSMLLDSLSNITKGFRDVQPEVREASRAWAAAVTDAVFRWSQSDNYAATRKMRRYALIKDGATWIPTPPGYFQAVEPHWGKIRTVTLDSLHAFRPKPAVPFGTGKESPFYQQAKEVYDKGRSLSREDSAIALFWDCNPFYLNIQGHVNYATKKLSPGGHWMSIAGIASVRSGAAFPLAVKAYLFTAVALFDAFISCWDEKYRSNTIRPESYINSYIDQGWRPVLQTPPFPEYTSGHSVISAASAVVLTSLFGDELGFVDNTEVPYGLPSREFSSFWDAANEAAISRFYGGIHYKSAIEQGLLQGEKIGRRVIERLTQLHVKGNASAQTGTVHEPVRYVGGVGIDPDVHEGKLRYAVGVESRQTLRANRTNPQWAEGFGWTYNHASSLSYWQGKFYQQYLSNPVDEHIAPGQTLLVTSADGRDWSQPKVIFPPYEAPAGVKVPEGYQGYMMHQRMGFYVAPNGRLLTLAFYGHAEDPFKEGGIGRVVREIHQDGSFGPIYFIRYSSHTSWNASNTSYPFYNTSKDTGFIRACEALLANRLMTLQWRDEDRGLDGFYKGDEYGGSAFCFYTRRDGAVVGLWKRSFAALSFDGGKYFSRSVKVPTLIMAGGKVWGQKTEDDRYALVYNPIEMDEHRYPLIAITGEDGIVFDDMVLVQGEVPPRRFFGRWKDFGPCYVRGIEPGNGDPTGNDMWLTYSMNKEDMWVSRVPVPIRYAVQGPVQDNFDALVPGGPIPQWNTYAPKWAPVNVVAAPAGKGNAIELRDEDPYDYARAIRVFETSEHAKISFDLMVPNKNSGSMEIDVADRYGSRPVRLQVDAKGALWAGSDTSLKKSGTLTAGRWHRLVLEVKAGNTNRFDLYLDARKVLVDVPFAEPVNTVERISFRTGTFRNLPGRKTPNEDPAPPLPGADLKAPLGLFYIDAVDIGKTK